MGAHESGTRVPTPTRLPSREVWMSPSQASFRLFFAQHLHQLFILIPVMDWKGARNSPAPKLKAKVACAETQQIGGQFVQPGCSYAEAVSHKI